MDGLRRCDALLWNPRAKKLAFDRAWNGHVRTIHFALKAMSCVRCCDWVVLRVGQGVIHICCLFVSHLPLMIILLGWVIKSIPTEQCLFARVERTGYLFGKHVPKRQLLLGCLTPGTYKYTLALLLKHRPQVLVRSLLSIYWVPTQPVVRVVEVYLWTTQLGSELIRPWSLITRIRHSSRIKIVHSSKIKIVHSFRIVTFRFSHSSWLRIVHLNHSPRIITVHSSHSPWLGIVHF